MLDAGFDMADIRIILPCARGADPTIEMCPIVAALRLEREGLRVAKA